MKNIVFQLEDLTCPSCIRKIEGVLNKTNGVQSARVLFNSSKVKIVTENSETDPSELAEKIEKLGYSVLSQKVSPSK